METLGARYLAVIYLLVISVAVKVSSKVSPNVQAPSGRYFGVSEPGNSGEPYEAFYGVPFAHPPIGDLRFANPVKFSYLHTVYAFHPKSDCLQKNILFPGHVISGSEDCLYLNLYRPKPNNNTTTHLPVIVFIHPGGFFSGSPGPSQANPQNFMNSGEVIFVTIAYRLGAFGFLSTGDANSPGNFGLKDQTMALQWVHDNVHSFGGDPNMVTIMGASVGASSVHFHMLSPLSRGLFHRGASISGSALGPYAKPTKDPLDLAIKQAELLNIPWQNSTSLLISRLRSKSAHDIVNSVDGLKFWSIDSITVYRPVIEPEAYGAFLTEDPAVTSKSGNYQHVPWITGSVDSEGAIRASLILTNATELADLNSRLDELLPMIFELSPTENLSLTQISDAIRRRYLDDKHIIDESNSQGFLDIYSDLSFLYPMYKSVFDFVRTAPSIEETPIFVYKFSFKGPYSFSSLLTSSNTDFGVVHLDDTLFMFPSSIFPPFEAGSNEAKMSAILVKYYVDFAVTGRPTQFGEQNACTEEIFENADKFCDFQHFNNGPSVHIDNYFDFSMVHFWDEILQST